MAKVVRSENETHTNLANMDRLERANNNKLHRPNAHYGQTANILDMPNKKEKGKCADNATLVNLHIYIYIYMYNLTIPQFLTSNPSQLSTLAS